MSLFRKPKKAIQRRVFSACEDDAENNVIGEKMDIDVKTPSLVRGPKKDKKKDKKSSFGESKSKKSLLSFVDDEEEGEVFQVKKSSHSKKVMRMMDKERRKKKYKDEKQENSESINSSESSPIQTQNNSNSDSIQTEIHTDDFVLVVKKSDPENIILNGRAAICAGRNDMSSEDEENTNFRESLSNHKFSKPDSFKLVLESGTIPDAAMIHAARKRRQKAREQSDFIPMEDHGEESIKKGKRLVREDGDEDASDDEEERVDMNAITGSKEREERREKFYSVQNEYSGDESEQEMNEWENQQIRKGVTGAQLVSAQQESVLSQFVIKSSCNIEEITPQSTATLLDQAYAMNCLEKPIQLLAKKKPDLKLAGPQTPQEVTDALKNKLTQLRELNEKHYNNINKINEELRNIRLDLVGYAEKAPKAADKYRFYQEIRGYVMDLIECFDEKVPQIDELEKRTLTVISKFSTNLVERRRQDVRDQAKETADSSRQGVSKRGPEDEEHIRRTAEREGRRTRRRCEREKNDFSNSHLDGMSSDDEMADHEFVNYRNNLDQIEVEADDLFEDASDDFRQIDKILSKFELWRKTDMDSYKDAFISLCLPKIVGPLIRVKMIVWNPLDENCQDMEKMDWFSTCMKYGWIENETEQSLTMDPDVRFVPALVEKIVLPKLSEIIENFWDPLSTTQTLRLIGLLGRLGRDFPSLRKSSKSLQTLFYGIIDKMKNSLENDVFIPIFPKQMQEAKTSFFQRQFCSSLKLFRNLLSWQGIIADIPLKELAISSLLNRYLLSAMRVCTPVDAVSKAYIIANTLPIAWLQSDSGIIEDFKLFIVFIKYIVDQFDNRNPIHKDAYDKAKQILQRLHSS